MFVTSRDVRLRERTVRHARRHGGVNVGVLLATGAGAAVTTFLLSGVIPGSAAAERLGMEVVTAVGGPLAQRLDGEAYRSTQRVDPTDTGSSGVARTAPARVGALPTWAGGGVDPATDAEVEPSPAVVEATAAPTGSPGTETTASPAPEADASVSGQGSVAAEATATTPPTVAASAGAVGSPVLPELEQRLVALTNDERAKVGCPALTVDPRLVTSAEAHAVDMVAGQYFDHNGQDGSTPTTRGAAAGYPAGVAENIGTGFTDPAAIMTAWMASDGHRANIVDCAYTVIGVGYDVGALPGFAPGTWVQTLGSV